MHTERIASALKYSGGTHTINDIIAGVLGGEYLLIENENASMVVEIEEFPQKRRYNIFLAAGKMSDVIELGLKVLSEADANGVEVSLYGRKGWERALKPYGFKALHTVLVRA